MSNQTRILLGIFLSIALTLVSCQTADDPQTIPAPIQPSSEMSNGEDLIQVGDQLEIFVKEDSSFNGTYRVREQGDIIIPAIGRIPVKELPVKQAERRIEQTLETNQLTEASVILDRVGSAGRQQVIASADKLLVYLTGAVRQPGQHVVSVPKGRPLGVYEAILITGGLGKFANESKVHVMRLGDDRIRHRIPVDIDEIKEGKKPDPALGEGDVIVVPEKVFGF